VRYFVVHPDNELIAKFNAVIHERDVADIVVSPIGVPGHPIVADDNWFAREAWTDGAAP
jgi:hypothetical protein